MIIICFLDKEDDNLNKENDESSNENTCKTQYSSFVVVLDP